MMQIPIMMLYSHYTLIMVSFPPRTDLLKKTLGNRRLNHLLLNTVNP